MKFACPLWVRYYALIQKRWLKEFEVLFGFLAHFLVADRVPQRPPMHDRDSDGEAQQRSV